MRIYLQLTVVAFILTGIAILFSINKELAQYTSIIAGTIIVYLLFYVYIAIFKNITDIEISGNGIILTKKNTALSLTREEIDKIIYGYGLFIPFVMIKTRNNIWNYETYALIDKYIRKKTVHKLVQNKYINKITND